MDVIENAEKMNDNELKKIDEQFNIINSNKNNTEEINMKTFRKLQDNTNNIKNVKKSEENNLPQNSNNNKILNNVNDENLKRKGENNSSKPKIVSKKKFKYVIKK